MTHEPFLSLTGQPQKKGVSPDTQKNQIKPVKDALSVNLSPAPPVTNVLSAAESLVGVKLPKFWQGWAVKGSSPWVFWILKEGSRLNLLSPVNL